jgi:ABC-type sulfate/molybdate transport systems ATPase subunit
MEAIAALVEGLKEFEGTVLFVSHDRWFVSQLATRIVEVTKDGLRDFPGTYAEYLERCGDDHLDADAVVSKAKAELPRSKSAPPPANGGSAGGSWEEQKKRRNRLQALPARRDKVLASIEAAEARKVEIAARRADPTFYELAAQGEAKALEREDDELSKKIAAWLVEWEQVERELASLTEADQTG